MASAGKKSERKREKRQEADPTDCGIVLSLSTNIFEVQVRCGLSQQPLVHDGALVPPHIVATALTAAALLGCASSCAILLLLVLLLGSD